MKEKLLRAILILLVLAHLPRTEAQTAFTYQGQLQYGGAPANGNFDLTFALYPTSAGGLVSTFTETNSSVSLSNGLFTTTLDFSNTFNGPGYWLEIGVRTNGGSVFVILSPRQAITPAPYAITAYSVIGNVTGNVSGSAGTVPASGVTGAHTLTDGVLSTNVPLLDAAQTFTEINTFTNLTVFSDYARLQFGSGNRATLYYNPGHGPGGFGELQMTFDRLSILPAYGAGQSGAVQFGAAGFGSYNGSQGLFYNNSSTHADAAHTTGYSYTWLDFYNYWNGANAVAGNVSKRAIGANTNGDGFYDIAYGTFSGVNSANAGPATNEALGALSLRVRVGPNADSAGLESYGAFIRDLSESTPASTNIGVDWDAPGLQRLNVASLTSVNLTNMPNAFARTNKTTTQRILLIPGTSSPSLICPANWLFATNQISALPTNIPAGVQLELEVRQDVGAETNFYLEGVKYFPYQTVSIPARPDL